MCWGLRPTLGFVLAEGVALSALMIRRTGNDRLNVFLATPLFVQEVLQLAIWTSLEYDADASQRRCSVANSVLTMAVCGVISFVPGWVALFSMLGQPLDGVGRSLRHGLKCWALLCAALSGMNVVCTYVRHQLGWGSYCTVPGPWGHQIWGFMRVPWVFRPVAAVFYQLLVVVPIITVRHRTLAHFGLVLVGATPPFLYVVLGDEWGSFWCFWASLMCFVNLFEQILLDLFLPEDTTFEPSARTVNDLRHALEYIFGHDFAMLILPEDPCDRETGEHQGETIGLVEMVCEEHSANEEAR